MTSFESIILKGWRQFADVEIDLSKQVTVLTGQNGCGKTTILNILNKHFGWDMQFVSTPYLGKKTAKKLWSDIYGHMRKPDGVEDDDEDYDLGDSDSASPRLDLREKPDDQQDWIEKIVSEQTSVGTIRYANGQECELQTQTLVSPQYALTGC